MAPIHSILNNGGIKSVEQQFIMKDGAIFLVKICTEILRRCFSLQAIMVSEAVQRFSVRFLIDITNFYKKIYWDFISTDYWYLIHYFI